MFCYQYSVSLGRNFTGELFKKEKQLAHAHSSTCTTTTLMTTLFGNLYGQLYCLAKLTNKWRMAGKCFEWISSTFQDWDPCRGNANSLLISSKRAPSFCFCRSTDCVTSVSWPRLIFASFSTKEIFLFLQ